MDDLTARVSAALDEAERIADAALSPDPDGMGSYLPDYYVSPEREDFDKRFTPQVVKALISAHREILALHARGYHGECETCQNAYGNEWPCATVRLVVKAYRIEVPGRG